jgi:O-acetylhomoserine/O-acetylserine sulfhydrylase-like pyridoxal-dependent enzyme
MVDVREPKNVANALKPNTKLVWFEAMSNPLLRISDIETIATIVHDYNKDIIVAVDNTFLSPYNLVSRIYRILPRKNSMTIFFIGCTGNFHEIQGVNLQFVHLLSQRPADQKIYLPG